ncbi:hypothetical protein Acr_17g0008830 [Actinidia rufa]|uniref:Eukaryotic aspartyl protease family protein n=1 Tax=Actinidia rufa TaxID=165716 RepID=A0A7J0G3F6_9ERIC|nr:hypothetical protein Acr_17g0008830 [Actinidia rufa]
MNESGTRNATVPSYSYPSSDHYHYELSLHGRDKSPQVLLGAFQQQNLWFTYDLAKKEVSFAKEDCTKDAA